jgi:hypothetical protein
VELLIGLDNTQWLPIHLEDSRNLEDNMQLMKSAFGHRFMIIGGWDKAFYPRDTSMRYQGDPTRERAGSLGGAQEARLQAYDGRRRGTGDQGRAEVRRQSPPQERMVPARGQRGTRGHQRGQGRRPVQSEPQRDTPRVRGRPIHSRPWLSRANAARPQQMQGQPRLEPRGMPGLLQPAEPADAMQRLALMMAVMILGVPQVYSCNARTGLGSPRDLSLS